MIHKLKNIRIPRDIKYDFYGEIDEENNVNEKIVSLKKEIPVSRLLSLEKPESKEKEREMLKIPEIIKKLEFIESKGEKYIIINDKYMYTILYDDDIGYESFFNGFNKMYYKFNGDYDRYIVYHSILNKGGRNTTKFNNVVINDNAFNYIYKTLETKLSQIEKFMLEYINSLDLYSRLYLHNMLHANKTQTEISDIIEKLVKFNKYDSDYHMFSNIIKGLREESSKKSLGAMIKN